MCYVYATCNVCCVCVSAVSSAVVGRWWRFKKRSDQRIKRLFEVKR